MPVLTIYANPNLKGSSASWLHHPDSYKPGEWRYRWIRRSTIKKLGLDNVTSSFNLGNGYDTPMSVVLFDEDWGTPSSDGLPGGFWGSGSGAWGFAGSFSGALPPLQGGFRAFATPQSRSVNELGAFDNRTSSALMIHHSPNEFFPISLAQQAREDATQLVDEALADVEEVSRRGPLGFGWEMWPDFDPTKTFATVNIPLTIDVPKWPSDYKASITYYIFLFIDAAGRLNAFVNWGRCWVEGGTWTNSIMWRLKGKAQQAMPVIDGELNAMLSEMDFHEWDDVYYMPGTASKIPHGDYDGNTYEDVTIMLVRRPGSPF